LSNSYNLEIKLYQVLQRVRQKLVLVPLA